MNLLTAPPMQTVLFDRLTQRSNNIHVATPEHRLRGKVEAFIQKRFDRVHTAEISQYMPTLIAISNHRGDIQAALGLTNAATGPLFVEHYLDDPIEQAILHRSGEKDDALSRNKIVEIGNLASINRKASQQLFRLLAEILIDNGMQWATFTGCASLRHTFSKLGLETFKLCDANQQCLPLNQQNWGSYYQGNPEVHAGRVECGKNLLDSHSRRNEVLVSL